MTTRLDPNAPIKWRLAEVMKKEPLLTNFGMGVFEKKYPNWESYKVVLEKRRADLRENIDRVELTAEWQRTRIQPIKTINTRSSSYGLKHVVEREIGYITNGVFIAAAMIEGYPYKTVWNFPNVYFGMSAKSWSVVRLAQLARQNEEDAR